MPRIFRAYTWDSNPGLQPHRRKPHNIIIRNDRVLRAAATNGIPNAKIVSE